MSKGPRFQILYVDDTGPRPIARADTIEEAKSTVLLLDRGWGSRFIISDELTGERIIFDGYYFLVNKSDTATS